MRINKKYQDSKIRVSQAIALIHRALAEVEDLTAAERVQALLVTAHDIQTAVVTKSVGGSVVK